MKPRTLADTLARAKLICIGATSAAWLLSGCTMGSPATSSVTSPVFTPSPIAAPKIPLFKALATSFGAIPDDGKDDTRAIQAGLDAVNAAGGGTLEFAAGRYDISIDPVTRRALTLYPRLRLAGSSVAGSSVAGSSVAGSSVAGSSVAGLRSAGLRSAGLRSAGSSSAGTSGATLRLADNQIVYESIMATATYPTRLDDVEFVNLTFDANGLSNPVKSPNETNGDLGTATLRYTIRSYAGERVRIQNCTFINLENGNTLSFNGVAVADIAIENSRFLAVGGASIDHDHSTIYTDGRRFRIANNQFQARDGAGTKGARTAVETHGDDIEVRGNTVSGYMQGANIVGRATDPSRQLFSGNTIKAVAVGLKIWPLGDVGPNDPRPAFTSLRLENNDIQVDADAWWASGAMVTDAPAGIAFEAGVSDGRVARLDIVNNRVRFDTFAGKTANEDRISVGLGLRGIEGKLQLETVNLLQNTIRNAIGPCILSTANLGSSAPSRIEGNTLTDCGRGPNLRDASLKGAGDVLRTGIAIGGTTRNLTLTQNTITTSTVPASTLNGFLLASSCSSACVVTANKTSGLQQAALIPGTGWTNSGP